MMTQFLFLFELFKSASGLDIHKFKFLAREGPLTKHLLPETLSVDLGFILNLSISRKININTVLSQR